MQVSRMGNMITQQVVVCPECQGRGECADARDRCKRCGGAKTVQEAKAITVHVEPGMEAGEQIRFRGCADEAPGAEAGDLVVSLQQKPHEFFLRRHADLLIAKKLTLAQALLGAPFVLTHLDGRKLVVSPVQGQVIAPEAVKLIEREGMPQRGGGPKGRLFVRFEVEFPAPAQLTPALRAAFTAALGVPDEAAGLSEDAEDVFPVRMQPGNIKEFNDAKSSRERRGEAYSSQEDEYEEAGQTAQCRPM
jgi:DnaJ family protein A protein 2